MTLGVSWLSCGRVQRTCLVTVGMIAATSLVSLLICGVVAAVVECILFMCIGIAYIVGYL